MKIGLLVLVAVGVLVVYWSFGPRSRLGGGGGVYGSVCAGRASPLYRVNAGGYEIANDTKAVYWAEDRWCDPGSTLPCFISRADHHSAECGGCVVGGNAAAAALRYRFRVFDRPADYSVQLKLALANQKGLPASSACAGVMSSPLWTYVDLSAEASVVATSASDATVAFVSHVSDGWLDLELNPSRALRTLTSDGGYPTAVRKDCMLVLRWVQVSACAPLPPFAQERARREPSVGAAAAERDEEHAAPSKAAADLWAVTVLFNPCGFATFERKFRQFAQSVRVQGIPLLVVDLAFTNDTGVLSDQCNPAQRFATAPRHVDADLVVRARSQSLLWHKERLYNLGLRALPPSARYVVFFDADVRLPNPMWRLQTLIQLQTALVVQPFGRTTSGKTAYARNAVLQESPWLSVGHPGYAWAFQRYPLQRAGGWYDLAVVGGGDRLLTQALALLQSPRDRVNSLDQLMGRLMNGSHPTTVLKPSVVDGLANSPGMAAALLAWIRRLADAGFARPGSLGFVDGRIGHTSHGTRQSRQYHSRAQILVDHAFDPARDLRLNEDRVYEWTDRQSPLAKAVLSYFSVRREGPVDWAGPASARTLIVAGPAAVGVPDPDSAYLFQRSASAQFSGGWPGLVLVPESPAAAMSVGGGSCADLWVRYGKPAIDRVAVESSSEYPSTPDVVLLVPVDAVFVGPLVPFVRLVRQRFREDPDAQCIRLSVSDGAFAVHVPRTGSGSGSARPDRVATGWRYPVPWRTRITAVSPRQSLQPSGPRERGLLYYPHSAVRWPVAYDEAEQSIWSRDLESAYASGARVLELMRMPADFGHVPSRAPFFRRVHETGLSLVLGERLPSMSAFQRDPDAVVEWRDTILQMALLHGNEPSVVGWTLRLVLPTSTAALAANQSTDGDAVVRGLVRTVLTELRTHARIGGGRPVTLSLSNPASLSVAAQAGDMESSECVLIRRWEADGIRPDAWHVGLRLVPKTNWDLLTGRHVVSQTVLTHNQTLAPMRLEDAVAAARRLLAGYRRCTRLPLFLEIDAVDGTHQIRSTPKYKKWLHAIMELVQSECPDQCRGLNMVFSDRWWTSSRNAAGIISGSTQL